jgi:adenosylcobinamide-GDP ribazoletransferase
MRWRPSSRPESRIQAASTRAAVAAVTFLTRLPLGRRFVVDAGDVGRGAVLFPLVGAGIGAVSGLAAAGLEGPLPPLVAGGLGVAVAVLLTGGLHLDALADSADALGAGSRARALEIMRDPRLGAFGVVAVALALLVEAGAVGDLAARGDVVSGFVVAGAVSRAVASPLASVLPYARADGGTGSVLSGRVSAPVSLAGCGLALLISVLLLGWDGAALAGAGAALAAVCGTFSRLWLGGVTGDTLGATIQLAEIGVLVVLLTLR